MNFKDKVLLVTGAKGGIGVSVSKVFFDLGAKVILSDLEEQADSLPGESISQGDALAKKLDSTGERAAFFPANVAKSVDCDRLADFCRNKFGGVDYLVMGAGIYRDQLVETMSDEQWKQSMEVNLDGVFYCCRAIIPLLKEGGSIVNLTSVAAHRGSYSHAHYAATKGAVLSFSRSLALELAPKIRVNAVSPGLIETQMIKARLENEGDELVGPTALKRVGQPDEVAKAIAFLCSDWASFITGETLHVNGGLYMAG
ncbi:SDR family NAD(P)-dependent oxidoreductase [uncultured Desulfuromusa sp.]|uniref:SDR family NAD(P)-dependent oxidoreductase n=1 Tax=uncultured Desulfuromusa sp. TaxID=219183 RepID=UPI002AA90B3C|nr:SDR family NAD(P)-dependent oxidoreductase [uncultured Desulfuromusa sp.]